MGAGVSGALVFWGEGCGCGGEGAYCGSRVGLMSGYSTCVVPVVVRDGRGEGIAGYGTGGTGGLPILCGSRGPCSSGVALLRTVSTMVKVGKLDTGVTVMNSWSMKTHSSTG